MIKPQIAEEVKKFYHFNSQFAALVLS